MVYGNPNLNRSPKTRPDNSKTTAFYISRINHVVDYIEQNLSNDFSLDELSKIACFSKFHFHRIFFSLMQETIFQFIQRQRIEKAAFILTAKKELSITEIAFDCGFKSSQSFSRTFKEHFKQSASEWRQNKNAVIADKENHLLSNNQFKHNINYKISFEDNTQIWHMDYQENEITVKVKKNPALTVAYYRYSGPYKGDAKLFTHLWSKLTKWALPRGLLQNPDTQYLALYHDYYAITDEQKLRVSVCLTIPPDYQVSGEIGKLQIAEGKYAAARFTLTSEEYSKAWDWVYRIWLPISGYQPDDGPAYEYFPVLENRNRRDKSQVVDICIPVKPL
jgi:AraC family transcriptional regulator